MVQKNLVKEYEPVKELPVARFYYKGSHSHPIRRTVLVIEENSTIITGYELREGNKTRNYTDNVIRSYRKDKIAKFGDYSRLRRNRRNYMKKNTESTLERFSFLNLLKKGI